MIRASTILSQRLPVVLAAACLLALTACGDKASQDSANRQVDAAVAKTENAVGVAHPARFSTAACNWAWLAKG